MITEKGFNYLLSGMKKNEKNKRFRRDRVIKRRVSTPEEISIFSKEEQKYLSKHLVLSTYVYFHSKYNAFYNDDGKINKRLTLIYLKKTNKNFSENQLV